MIQTRAYLTKAGHQLLDRRMGEQRYLYNCALEHRRNAYKMRGESVSKNQQSAEFTVVRREDLTEYFEVDRRLSIGTLDRLHKAYNAMFGRWRRGESKLGFPRFKSESRFRTLEIYSGANKYMKLDEESDKGHIQIKGLPRLRFKSGRIPAGQQPKHILITRKPNGVYLSMSFEFDAAPIPDEDTPPANPVGIDVGVSERATLSNGESIERREPREWEREKRRLLRKMQRQRDAAIEDGRAELAFDGFDRKTGQRKYRFKWMDGRYSRSYAKTRRRFEKASHRVNVRNYNALHRESARLVAEYDFIAVEDLKIPNMTRSARGTEDEPGKNVAQKRGLNREILYQNWGRFTQYLAYKAESAGKRFVKVDPKYTSQTCPSCGAIDAKSRSGKSFDCRHCDFAGDADVVGATTVLVRGMASIGFPCAGERTPRGASVRLPTGSVDSARPENRNRQLVLPGFG